MRVRRGDDADRRLLALADAVAALENPLHHAQVLAEARPDELSASVGAEPVHAEHLRRLRHMSGRCRASAGSSRPCCSRRTRAWPWDRGAARRSCPTRRPWSRTRASRRETRRAASSSIRTRAARGAGGARRTSPRRAARRAGSRTRATARRSWSAGVVKRAFGCVAFSGEAGVHGRPCQSSASAGGGSSCPSHHGVPSGRSAAFV